MKDVAHHLKHIQKKVIRAVRKEKGEEQPKRGRFSRPSVKKRRRI